MYVLTYSLEGAEKDSNKYYDDVSKFARSVLKEGLDFLELPLKEYLEYLKVKDLVTYSKEEALLELLILGVLWRIYSGDAKVLNTTPMELLIKLSEVRNISGKLKPGVDLLKGILSTIFLSPDLYDNLSIAEPSILELNKLLNWLSATGEFNQEVKHLKPWLEFFTSLDIAKGKNFIALAITFALWFEALSNEVIGKYTVNVERFLNEFRPEHYWREDVIFCGRRRVEYHLNMVGAEIMNMVFKSDFDKTHKKVLILPACIKINKGSKCKAQTINKSLVCKGCSSECEANKLTILGRKLGVKVIMVAHESSISAGNNKLSLNSDTGVIGVSCVLNLISGGWLLKEIGIPAQCVLLDYCGCKNHWHKEGIPTKINANQLKKVIDKK